MKLLIVAIPFHFISLLSGAQAGQNDSIFYSNAITSIKQNYINAAKENLPFYNGSEYVRYIPRTKGHPFFSVDSFVAGSIFYDGVLYNNIRMQYDLVNDKVLIHNYAGDFIMELGSEKIKYFSIANHIFERQTSPQEIFDNKRDVFLDLIYAGKSVTGYVKREKVFLQPLRAEDSIPHYEEYTRFYVKKDEKFYPVSSIRGLAGIFTAKKEMLKEFARNNNISMGKIEEESMKMILAYYEQTAN